MKQTLSLTPSSDALGLDPWFSGSPLIIYGDVPAYPTMATWQMKLWKYPHEASEEDAEPIATAYGSVNAGVMTIAFSASQLTELELSSAAGSNNHYLILGGVDSSNEPRVVRAGCIEFVPCPFGEPSEGITTTFTIVDDVVTFEYDGQVYSHAVSPIDTPPGAVEGGIIVVDDVAIYTLGGASYTTTVVPIDEVPTAGPSENTTEFITGTDGATYAKTTTPTGEIYYQPVFTAAP